MVLVSSLSEEMLADAVQREMAVRALAKVVTSLLNSTSIHNAETLPRPRPFRPPAGVPLITVSNHVSTFVPILQLIGLSVCVDFGGLPLICTSLKVSVDMRIENLRMLGHVHFVRCACYQAILLMH